MKKNGGYATLGFLNQNVDVSKWVSKTPFASIRRIVQDPKYFFNICPGLWALNEVKLSVLKKFDIQEDNVTKESMAGDAFSHAYYQGLIIDMGNMKNFRTYVPPQDANKKYLEMPLKSIVTEKEMLPFSYPKMVNRAKTIDVIWFNNRQMPYSFFEIEHTTDIQNSLLKFIELQDFFVKFYIIARSQRKKEFLHKLAYGVFDDIRERVDFMDYDELSNLHTKTSEMKHLRSL